MARQSQTRKDIARDLKQPRHVVSRPVKKEQMATIYKVANEAAANRDAKLLCNVQGAFYAHPRAPGATPSTQSNWQQGKKPSDRAMARLLGNIR